MHLQKPVVAVTGLNATDNPGPGVGVIRALRRDPSFAGSVVGLAYDALDPGLYVEGLLDAAFMLPYPSVGRDAWMDRLAYISAQVALDVLIPNLDRELPALLDQEACLASMGIATMLPTSAQHDLRAKAQLHHLARTAGLPVPPGCTVSHADALYGIHERFEGPLVVKGAFHGAEVCHTVHDAVRAFHRTSAEWGMPVVIQQYAPGEEVNVCAVGDGRGGLVGAVPMKKLMQTRSGKGWAGVTIKDAALLELAATFMQCTQWRGPCELEVRREVDGTLHLIEVNPRFPAWCALTAGAGQNLVSAVVQLALGLDPGTLPPYKVGTAFVRVALDQILDISALESITTRGEVLPSTEWTASAGLPSRVEPEPS
ncbi:MAG: hypothetical protein CL927_12365 [Deltaproteobacteria bacterium]|mgnify:CR=1 FL=1|nr:hypothetical protein [Deltaproteobacteria bacterium]HCH64359.1 hypothetical protein [Deltaproteobacteria bacterium]